MLQSVLALPEHLDVFDTRHRRAPGLLVLRPAGGRLAKLVAKGKINIGAIHTYLELFGRYFIDLTPQRGLVAAQAADRHGNLYTGPNTEDTPADRRSHRVQERHRDRAGERDRRRPAARRHPGRLGRLRGAGADPALHRTAVHARPGLISEIQVLMAMMAIKGIYAEYQVSA
jgi:malonate decarboxylase alpha subunit